MKPKFVLAFTLSLFLLVACSRTWTLAMVKDYYGPPGKIEKTSTTTTYLYYFYQGKLQGGALGSGNVTLGSGQYSEGWKVWEFVADRETEKVIKFREYWKQPVTPPK